MKMKINIAALATGLLAFTFAVPTVSADGAKKAPAKTAKTTTAAKGAKPADSPGWIVLEEDFWYPWRLEPLDWFHNAETHYRQKETKAATSEIRKSESWLKFAATHADPHSKKFLNEARADLKTLADDLDNGKISAASRMDKAIAKASHALAEWHYFKANEGSLGKREEGIAASNLQTAARYLKNAADSAEFEYGDDMVGVYDDIFGWDIVDVEPNELQEHYAAVKKELDRVNKSLEKAADSE